MESVTWPANLVGYNVKVVENRREFSYIAAVKGFGVIAHVERDEAQEAVNALSEQVDIWEKIIASKESE